MTPTNKLVPTALAILLFGGSGLCSVIMVVLVVCALLGIGG